MKIRVFVAKRKSYDDLLISHGTKFLINRRSEIWIKNMLVAAVFTAEIVRLK